MNQQERTEADVTISHRKLAYVYRKTSHACAMHRGDDLESNLEAFNKIAESLGLRTINASFFECHEDFVYYINEDSARFGYLSISYNDYHGFSHGFDVIF